MGHLIFHVCWFLNYTVSKNLLCLQFMGHLKKVTTSRIDSIGIEINDLDYFLLSCANVAYRAWRAIPDRTSRGISAGLFATGTFASANLEIFDCAEP
jgi:hypothetical protein